MRSLDSWFQEYSESHQHPVNQQIHYVCVPVIFFSVVGLLFPWSLALLLPVSVFYVRLDPQLGGAVSVLALLCWGTQWSLSQVGFPLVTVNAAFFVLAWIGQFVGHRIEGKRPSFLKDLAFLLIGPLWVVRKSAAILRR